MPSSIHSVTDTPPSLLPTTPTPLSSRRGSKVSPAPTPTPTTPARTQSLIGLKASDITTTVVGTQSVKLTKTKDTTQVTVKPATPPTSFPIQSTLMSYISAFSAAAPFSAQDETENKLDQIAQNKMSIWHNAEAVASSDDESPAQTIDPRLPTDIPVERRVHRDDHHGRSRHHHRNSSTDDKHKHSRKHSSQDGTKKHSRKHSTEDGHNKHSRKHSTEDGSKHHRKHSTDGHGHHRKSSHHRKPSDGHHRHRSHGGHKDVTHDDEHIEFRVVTDDIEQQQQRKSSIAALDEIGKATVDDEFDQPIEIKKTPTVVVTAVATSSSSSSTSTSTIPSTTLSPAPKLRPSPSQEKLNHEHKSPSPASPMVGPGRPPLHVNTATAGRLSLNVTSSPVSPGHRLSSSVGGIPLSPSNLGPPSPASPQHSAYSPILGGSRIPMSGSSPILSSMRSSFLLPPPTPTSIIHRGSLAMSDPSSPLAHPLKLMRFQTHSSFSPIRSLIDASPSFFAAMVSVFSLSLLCLLAFTIILPLRLYNIYVLSWFYTFIPLYVLVVSQCWLLIYKIIDNRRAPKVPNASCIDEKENVEMNKMERGSMNENGSINEKTVTFGRLSLKASSINSTTATSPSHHTRHRSITSLENTNVTHINQRRGSNKYTNVMLISVTTLSLFILTLLAYLESDAVTPIVVTLPLLAFFLGLFLISLIYAERYTFTTFIYKFVPHTLWFVFFALVGAKSNGTITASWYTCFIPAYVACIIFIQYIMRLSNHIVISKNTTRSTTLMTSAVTLIVFVVFVSMYLEDNTIMTPVAMFVPLWSCWISSFICCCTFVRAKDNPYEFDDDDEDETLDQKEREQRIQAKKQAQKEQTLMDRYELDMAYFSDKAYTHHQNNTCFCL